MERTGVSMMIYMTPTPEDMQHRRELRMKRLRYSLQYLHVSQQWRSPSGRHVAANSSYALITTGESIWMVCILTHICYSRFHLRTMSTGVWRALLASRRAVRFRNISLCNKYKEKCMWHLSKFWFKMWPAPITLSNCFRSDKTCRFKGWRLIKPAWTSDDACCGMYKQLIRATIKRRLDAKQHETRMLIEES